MKYVVTIIAAVSLFGMAVLGHTPAFAGDGAVSTAVEEGAGAKTPKKGKGPKAKARKQYFKGMMMINHERYDDAVGFFEKANKFNPSHYNTHLMLAKTYVALDRYDDAVGILQKAVALAPSRIKANEMLIELYLYLEKPEKALETAEAALAAGLDEMMLSDLGWVYYQNGRLDKAEAYFNREIELGGEAYMPLRNLGIIGFARGDYMGALKRYNEAEKLDPNSGVLPYLKALAFIKLGDDPNAFRELEVFKLRSGNLVKKSPVYNKRYFPNTEIGDIKRYIFMLKEGAPGT